MTARGILTHMCGVYLEVYQSLIVKCHTQSLDKVRKQGMQ